MEETPDMKRGRKDSNQEEMQHFVRLVTSTQKDFTLKFDNPLKISVFSSFFFFTIMIFYESPQTHTRRHVQKKQTHTDSLLEYLKCSHRMYYKAVGLWKGSHI